MENIHVKTFNGVCCQEGLNMRRSLYSAAGVASFCRQKPGNPVSILALSTLLPLSY